MILFTKPTRTQTIKKNVEISKFSRDIPTDFLQNKREEIRNIITKLENNTRNQNDADDNYADFIHMIKQEIYQKVNYKEKNEIGQNNKKRRTKKPWWSEELTVIWNWPTLAKTSSPKGNDRSPESQFYVFLLSVYGR